jgi:uncharacterized membrane protein YdjX (TVP38/TMEM64 family)
MVDGAAAASLGVLARDRWRALGAEGLPPVRNSPDEMWPADVEADLTDVPVAISLTMPRPLTRDSDAPVRDAENLFVDSIAAAQRLIYIESQYFTNARLSRCLAARLAEETGPEVIVVMPWDVHGWLEQKTIGPFRDRVCRQLIAADRHKRLRLVYPVAARSRDVDTFVHSKVMIVDDLFARIGSTNFNNRSMSVDTECDLAVEADADSRTRNGILRIRDRLLGEHLGLKVDEVAAAIERAGSVGALIDACASRDRTLERIELQPETEDAPSEAMQAAVDPNEAMGFGGDVERLIPAVDATDGGSPLRIWILPSVVLAAAAIVAWNSLGSYSEPELREAQRALQSMPRTPVFLLVAAGIFLLGGLALIPLELLAMVAGVLFGPLIGASVALAGSLISAVAGYAIGRTIGPPGIARWISRSAYRSGQRVAAKGVMGVVMLRLASVASAGAVHLLCGAGRVPFGPYLLGTAIGMLPPMAALAGLGALLRQTLLAPSIGHAFATIGVALLLLLIASIGRVLTLIRQFAPARASQRRRAEFG